MEANQRNTNPDKKDVLMLKMGIILPFCHAIDHETGGGLSFIEPNKSLKIMLKSIGLGKIQYPKSIMVASNEKVVFESSLEKKEILA